MNEAKAYLAIVTNPKKELPRLKDVNMVREFVNAFPKMLSGSSSRRNVDFVVEVCNEAEHILCLSYRMEINYGMFMKWFRVMKEINRGYFLGPIRNLEQPLSGSLNPDGLKDISCEDLDPHYKTKIYQLNSL